MFFIVFYLSHFYKSKKINYFLLFYFYNLNMFFMLYDNLKFFKKIYFRMKSYVKVYFLFILSFLFMLYLYFKYYFSLEKKIFSIICIIKGVSQ